MELFLASPLYLGYAFMLGVIVGSFLNVFIYRFHTGRSLSGHSHCLSCQMELRWYELVPLVSYVTLRGRCRSCGSYIPPRYFLVELATGCVFVLSASYFETVWWQLSSALFLAVLICITVYDLYHTIIPDELTIALLVMAIMMVGIEAYIFGFWANILAVGTSALLSGVAAAGPFFFLWVISKGRWIGLGDAKLAAPLGMVVGLEAVFSFIVLSFWIGAVISLVLIGLQHILMRGQMSLRIFGRPLTMKSEVPFAPFLILSFIITFFMDANVLSLLNYVI